MAKTRTGLLLILDGFGINTGDHCNAVSLAKTPTLDRLNRTYSHTELNASESHVGLPKGFMGNSEVGHLNIGAGRVVFQDFSLISRAIEDGSFFENPALVSLISSMQQAKDAAGTLHLLGLVSDGGVHSHLSHLFALIQLAKRNQIADVAIHVITDGRDTSPTSGAKFVGEVMKFCRDAHLGRIATVSGRFFAMDRDNRWDRTQAAYEALVGRSDSTAADPIEFIQEQYASGITDEFIAPTIMDGFSGIRGGDSLIFYNFRADRARQITRAFFAMDFSAFPRGPRVELRGLVTMTPYDETFPLPAAFEKPKVPNTLGEVVSQQGWRQLRIAETEKYAHVTYFLNGGLERVFEGEKRVLIPSPREVKTYDLKPEMNAVQVTDSLLTELSSENYKFAVVNFANPDMVGHTGNLAAAVKAIEVIDGCLARIIDWVESNDAFALLTADHGNCEQMCDEMGLPMTSHTLFPVPFVVVDPSHKNLKLAPSGRLCDIAPTLLTLWGIPIPSEMTGRSLIQDKLV